MSSWIHVTRKFLQMHEVHVSLCATDDEREAVYRLRHRVFNEELGESRPHQDGAVRKPWDVRSYHLQATVDGQLAGCLSYHRLVDGPTGVAVDAFWGTEGLDGDARARIAVGEQAIVVPEHRGRGVAVAIFWTFYRHLLEMGCRVALMCCHLPMTRYYTPFGWRRQHQRSRHPYLGGDSFEVLRHDLHGFLPMLRRASPLVLQLAGWRLRGSPITRPAPTSVGGGCEGARSG